MIICRNLSFLQSFKSRFSLLFDGIRGFLKQNSHFFRDSWMKIVFFSRNIWQNSRFFAILWRNLNLFFRSYIEIYFFLPRSFDEIIVFLWLFDSINVLYAVFWLNSFFVCVILGRNRCFFAVIWQISNFFPTKFALFSRALDEILIFLTKFASLHNFLTEFSFLRPFNKIHVFQRFFDEIRNFPAIFCPKLYFLHDLLTK